MEFYIHTEGEIIVILTARARYSGVFILFAVAVLVSHFTGQYAPWYPRLAFLAFAILATFIWKPDSVPRTVGVIALLAAAYRLFIFIDAPSLFGVDPYGYKVLIETTQTMGSVPDSSVAGFYSVGSIFLINTSVGGIVLGLPVEDVYAIYPFISAVVSVSLSAAFTRHSITNPGSFQIAAAAFVGVSALSLFFSWITISQSLAMVYFFLVCYLIAQYHYLPSQRFYCLLGLLIIAMMFTHKLGMVLLSIVAVGILILLLGQHVSRHVGIPTLITPIVTFHKLKWLTAAILITTFLQLIVTNYLGGVLFKIFQVGGSINVSSPAVATANVSSPAVATANVSSPVVATAAKPALKPLRQSLVVNASNIVLFAFGGIAWSLLYRKSSELPQVVILAGSAAGVITSLIGLITGIGFRRILGYTEPIFIILIIIGLITGFSKVLDRSQIQRAAVGVVIIGLLAPSLLVSPYAAPDTQNYGRMYVQPSEQAAGSFASHYTPSDEKFVTDFYFRSSLRASPVAYWQSSLIRGEFTSNRVLFRNMKVYSVFANAPRRNYVPTYNPEALLDSEYSRVFDTGQGNYYVNNMSPSI